MLHLISNKKYIIKNELSNKQKMWVIKNAIQHKIKKKQEQVSTDLLDQIMLINKIF